jgi:hypothetical protein
VIIEQTLSAEKVVAPVMGISFVLGFYGGGFSQHLVLLLEQLG